MTSIAATGGNGRALEAWEESAAIESWSRIGMSEEQVKRLLGAV